MSKIIVFDGVCNFCSGWVRFVLARDRRRQFAFAATQGRNGKRLMRERGLNPDDPVSLLLIEGDAVYTDSEAVIRALLSLGGGWRMAAAARLMPRPVRDALYRWFARNRYRFFGKRARCFAPIAEHADRFLE